MCFLPRRALRIADCEIARAYKVHGSSIEPIAFIVPRKVCSHLMRPILLIIHDNLVVQSDSFQSDIFPPAPSIEPSLSASEFFNGKVVPRKLVDLSNGSTLDGPKPSAVPSFSATTPATPASASVSSPYTIQPTRTFSASAPTPAAAPQPAAVSIPEPKRTFSMSPSSTPVIAAEVKTPSRSQTSDSKVRFTYFFVRSAVHRKFGRTIWQLRTSGWRPSSVKHERKSGIWNFKSRLFVLMHEKLPKRC